MDTTVRDPLVGRVLDGRYEVEGRLARGGMAMVYRALDRRLDRTVAVKVMHGGLAEDADFVARFIREAKAAARLSHPNVVAVYDQGADDGAVFLAMEYVEGRTLREALRQRGSLTPGEALGVLEPVLAALGAAHDAGIVHRDVKPENVLLAEDGRVKVADFGLARAAGGTATNATSTGILLGTVAYLAPEQVERGIADARSDVYAAGILLYEMLTGRQPFVGETPIQVAFAHVHDDVPGPSGRVPGLPPALDALVARATARDPDRRPADANRLLAEAAAARRALPPEALDLRAARVHDDDLTVAVPISRPRPAGAEGGGGDETSSFARTTGGLEATGWPDAPVPGAGRRRGRRRLGPLALTLVVLLAAVLSGVAWYLGAGPGRYVATPSLLRLPEAQAAAKARDAGLGVRVEQRAYDEQVAAGLVLRTSPGPGERVRKGGVVALTVSRGPERYAVPSLVNAPQAAAEAALRAANLSVGQVQLVYSDEVDRGRVVASQPAAGVRLKRGEAVTLQVSRGPAPVPVPSVVGRPLDEARSTLSKAAFKVTVRESYDERTPKGSVVSQSPDSGAAARGSTVALVVSLGPPLVEVPDVLGRPIREARRVLAAAGFEVRAFGPGNGRVFTQSPRGGKQPKGSTITLFYI